MKSFLFMAVLAALSGSAQPLTKCNEIILPIKSVKKAKLNPDVYDDYWGDDYISIHTHVELTGYYDEHPVYTVNAIAEIHSFYIIQQVDEIIIRTGQNATTLTINNPNDISPTIYYNDLTNSVYQYYQFPWSSEPSRETIRPTYSNSGADFEFQLKQTGFSDLVFANYSFVATDTTAVEVSYIHNSKLFTNNVSVSYGPIGTTIQAPDCIIHTANSITIKANNHTMTKHEMTPEDFEFAGQYYFYEKSQNHCIDGLDFSSKRLRCGFIENERINLSPNRTGAGNSYLELSFSKKIYRFQFELSFWSNGEGYSFDTAKEKIEVQFLTETGWCTYLTTNKFKNVSKDRYNPDEFDVNVIDGAIKMRIVAEVKNPNNSKNKGRISLGNIVAWDAE